MNDVKEKNKITTLEEKRCTNKACNKLLLKAKFVGLLEIKCGKCGRFNLFKA